MVISKSHTKHLGIINIRLTIYPYCRPRAVISITILSWVFTVTYSCTFLTIQPYVL